HVPISTSFPSPSQYNTHSYAHTQKVGVPTGNGFNRNDVSNVLNSLQQCGVFVTIISETRGTVTGADGTKLIVDQAFLTTSPYLVDSLYVVGGSSKNQAKFNQDMTNFVQNAYTHYKPIGVASTGQSF